MFSLCSKRPTWFRFSPPSYDLLLGQVTSQDKFGHHCTFCGKPMKPGKRLTSCTDVMLNHMSCILWSFSSSQGARLSMEMVFSSLFWGAGGLLCAECVPVCCRPVQEHLMAIPKMLSGWDMRSQRCLQGSRWDLRGELYQRCCNKKL